MIYLLHIDTSTDAGIVALSGDGNILFHMVSNESRNHAAAINLAIQSISESAGITLSELSAIAVCGGPGSYTGLRIGLATAKGLCYALSKPLIMDNKLTILANQAFRKYSKSFDYYVSLLVARDKEYFISIYDNEFNCSLSPQHIAENELKNILSDKEKIYFSTNASPNIISDYGITDFHFDTDINVAPDAWCKADFDKFKCHEFEILSSSEPFYLKQVYTHK